ncbi:putative F-box protein At3g58860 [Malus sylvestris]|nr:putative F-box protein At3g58860 [Malus domestica]XP_050136085.1 putative F-box protein At3g58860 [Malus sylvestris]
MYQTVINRILPLLPTTPAAQMSILSKQWEGLRSSVFVLDFNEGHVHHNFDDQRPRNFIKDWDRYLDQFRENDKQLLYKFKLHMRYFDGDATIVCKWLNFAIERGVNELDISLPKENWEDKVECKPNTKYFCHIPDKFFSLSLETIGNAAKSLTSLNLEYVEINRQWRYSVDITLPSLKSLSMKKVELDNFTDFFKHNFKCPSIEYLSLTSCNLRDYSVSRSSLKSLKIILCTCEENEVAAKNLESFKFVSSTSDQRCTAKHVTLREAKHLRNFVIWAGQDNVEATIIIPNISLSFSGFLKASAWAAKLWEASITLPDIELPTTAHWTTFLLYEIILKVLTAPEKLH